MQSNSSVSFIIFGGLTILCIFTFVVASNLVSNNNESNSYYVKVDDNVDAKIESVNIVNGKLVIKASGNTSKYCVKSTKTIPNDNNICWKDMIGETASTTVYGGKKYYVWIKDVNNNISNVYSVK